MDVIREIDVKYRFKEVDCPIAEQQLNQAKRVGEVFNYLKHETKEMLIVVNLTNDLSINCFEVIATGSIAQVSVRLPEVIHTAVILNCPKLALVHNHPSGDPKPSQADIRFTQRLSEVCDLMEINLVDHVIIGRDNYFSLQEQLPHLF